MKKPLYQRLKKSIQQATSHAIKKNKKKKEAKQSSNKKRKNEGNR